MFLWDPIREELTLFQWANAQYPPVKSATVPVRNYNFPKLVQTTKVKRILFISRLYQVDQANILCMEIKFETFTELTTFVKHPGILLMKIVDSMIFP